MYLVIEEGENSADLQVDIAKKIFCDLKDWDQKIKEYACNNLLKIVDEWKGERITKEVFIEKMGVPDITVERDGHVSFLFEPDNLCSDHAGEVETDECGNLLRADIVG